MTPKRTGLAAGLLVAALLPGWAAAQPLSNEGWSYNSGSNMHAQSQILHKQQKSAASSSASGGAVVYSSTTIGNMNQITQILDKGAQAYLDTNLTQSTTGTQSSTTTGGGTTVTNGANNGGSAGNHATTNSQPSGNQ